MIDEPPPDTADRSILLGGLLQSPVAPSRPLLGYGMDHSVWLGKAANRSSDMKEANLVNEQLAAVSANAS